MKFTFAILTIASAFVAYNAINAGDTFLALGAAVFSLAFFVAVTIK